MDVQLSIGKRHTDSGRIPENLWWEIVCRFLNLQYTMIYYIWWSESILVLGKLMLGICENQPCFVLWLFNDGETHVLGVVWWMEVCYNHSACKKEPLLLRICTCFLHEIKKYPSKKITSQFSSIHLSK